MRRVAGRDEEALAALYDRLAPAAYGLALSTLRDAHEAQEVVQDAFLTLWGSSRYRPERGSPRAYLLTIVRNRALDALRRRRSRGRSTWTELPESLSAEEDAEEIVERREGGRQVRSALADLPSLQRQALVLAYYGGLTHRDIAQRLRVPIGTVKGRIRLGLERLQRGLPLELREPLDRAA